MTIGSKSGDAAEAPQTDAPAASGKNALRIHLTLYVSTGFTLEAERNREADDFMTLKIGEMAERGGVNRQTIRYYERERLLPEPPRLPSGYRMFPESAVRRVRFIKRAQELGFSLAEIRELLSLQLDPAGSRVEVRALAEAKISDIEGKIRNLESMRKVLSRLTSHCSGCAPTTNCPILESIESEEALV